MCSGFYSRLYSRQEPNQQQSTNQQDILSLVSNQLSSHMTHLLADPLTVEELHMALKQMAHGRSPGPDSITAKFFYRFWDLLRDDFTKMVQDSVAQGRFPAGVTLGTIILLYKIGDHADLSSWRLMTLLNASYKIVAKALQIRI